MYGDLVRWRKYDAKFAKSFKDVCKVTLLLVQNLEMLFSFTYSKYLCNVFFN